MHSCCCLNGLGLIHLILVLQLWSWFYNFGLGLDLVSITATQYFESIIPSCCIIHTVSYTQSMYKVQTWHFHYFGLLLQSRKVLFSCAHKLCCKEKKVKECIAIYGVSLAVWDHTVLPSTRHKRTHPTFTPAIQAGTRFTDHLRMEGWVSSGPGCKEQLAHGCYATARSQRDQNPQPRGR